MKTFYLALAVGFFVGGIWLLALAVRGAWENVKNKGGC